MNEFLQMFKEEQKLLKKLKKKIKKSTSVFQPKSNTFIAQSSSIQSFDIPKNDSPKQTKKRQSNQKANSSSAIPLSSYLDNLESKNATPSGGGSHSGGGGSVKFKSNTAQNTSAKGGVVINNQSVVVKTNFEMSGRLNKNGKRPNSKEVGSHASASMNYMDNHGANDLKESDTLSNTYHENGDRMTQEEFKDLQSNLKEGVQGMRRIIIDVNQKDFDREDLNKLVRESMQQFKEDTGKDFEFKFALHFDTDQPHAHITAYGSNADINFTKEHLQNFKEIVGDKTEEITLEKSLEHDHDLSLNQQIDKELDGILDNKIENDHTQDQDNSKGLSM